MVAKETVLVYYVDDAILVSLKHFTLLAADLLDNAMTIGFGLLQYCILS